MANDKCRGCEWADIFCRCPTESRFADACNFKPVKPTQKSVSHPDHYSGDIECIDAIKACMSEEEYQGFLKGNVLKYLWRYKLKGGADDLDKASVYLAWLRESYGEGEKIYGQ